MSSFVPSVNVGRNDRREHFNLGQDTHTTSEVGYIQPTYCRYIIPGSTSKISSRNLVRLSPLAVPTMGRLSMRNYFYFVDLATLWTPFDAMRKAVNYTYGDGSVQVPLCVPSFRLVDFFTDLVKPDSSLTRSQFIREVRESIVMTVYKNGTAISSNAGAVTEISNIYASSSITDLPWYPYVICQVTGQGRLKSGQTASALQYATNYTGSGAIAVTNQSADFSWTRQNGSDTIQILGKFTGASKRLRKIFLGCGYSFNPNSDDRETPLKLFAVYKAWFDTFAVQREINFNNTSCYRCIKYLSETKPLVYHNDPSTYTDYVSIYDTSDLGSGIQEIFTEFICQLNDICYNLPPDYFSASDITAQRGSFSVGQLGSGGTTIFSPISSTGSSLAIGATSNNTNPTQALNNASSGNGLVTYLGNVLAQQLGRLVNKRSVVGKKIADLLKLDDETDLHNNEHETVHHLGVDKTDINISDVTSLASTSDASLGDFAGRGLGMSNTDTFVYDNKNYGILLCLSCVVPTSGYFQGILRENSDSNRFEFFDQAFDAVGYQSVRMNELVADLQFQTSSGANPLGTNLGNFGLAPRMQHLKVGRNICNGDMSLPSLQDVMLPYNLDRHFITKVTVGNAAEFGDVGLPTNTPESFRQIRANDAYGNYNRIFQYVGSDFDHFIIQMVFDVDVMSPMKSIANSYDTFQDDDTTKLEFEHQ